MSTIDPGIADAVKQIADLGAQARGVTIQTVSAPARREGLPSHVPVGIVYGATPKTIDIAPHFEAWRTHPASKVGRAELQTLQAFVALTNRHKTVHSAVFANVDWKSPSLTAIIDYHQIAIGEAAETVGQTPHADNLKHRLVYAYPLSDTWKAWVERNAEAMTQTDFAAWIEDQIASLASPFEAEKIALERDFLTTVATPADLMRLSRGLQVHVESRVKTVTNLQTGAGQIAWDETHNDADGKPLVVPGVFILSVSPFIGGEPIRIPVRLRYRHGGGKLTWFYQIYRPDQFIAERIADDIAIVAKETGLPVFAGKPEA